MFETENATQEIPDSSGSPEVAAAPETPDTPQVLDVDSLEKFKFQGREWTPQELKTAYLMERDYRLKTSQLSESRNQFAQQQKYYENLPYDLKNVANNPQLAGQFRQIYPQAFHKYLDDILGGNPQAARRQEQGQPPVDHQFMQRLNQIEERFKGEEIKAINAELDVKFEKLGKQFPYADEEAIVSRAQFLIEQGKEMTDKLWSELWKSSNDRMQKVAESRYAEGLKAQRTTNQKAKEIDGGGGIPGPKAKQPKTIREASELALLELQGL